VYVRFVGYSLSEEEMLACRLLETNTKTKDVFKVVTMFFDKNGMKRERLVGVSTDGVPALLGTLSEFIARIQRSWISLRYPPRGYVLQDTISCNER